MTWKVAILRADKRGADVAEIHPTDGYSEQHHRGSVLNESYSVGADGTGRYPDTSGHLNANLGGTAEACKLSSLVFTRDGGFF